MKSAKRLNRKLVKSRLTKKRSQVGSGGGFERGKGIKRDPRKLVKEESIHEAVKPADNSIYGVLSKPRERRRSSSAHSSSVKAAEPLYALASRNRRSSSRSSSGAKAAEPAHCAAPRCAAAAAGARKGQAKAHAPAAL